MCGDVGHDGCVSESGKQLGTRIVRGSVWTAARQAVQQSCSLAQLVLVARLMPPSEVGLFAMATLVLNITRALTETGFEQALIQRKELDDETLDVGWTAVLLRAALIASIVAAGASWFASFFAEPRVAELLRVLAAGLFIEGFINNRLALFLRNLDFRRYFFFHASGQLFGLIATIAAALALHNVWAIVIGQLASAGARVVSSYVLYPRRPRLHWNAKIARDLIGYGRWVGASSVLLFVLVQGDNLFIGKLAGAAELAYYAWAYQLANLPALFITQILSSVMFPAFAAVRTEPERLGALWVRSMRITIALTLPSAALIAVLAEPFTRALLGERWLPIVPLTYALSIFGVMRAFGASAGALFLAVGRPDLRTKIQIAQLVVLAATIYPLYLEYGVLGVAWSVSSYGLLSVYAAVLCFRACDSKLGAIRTPLAQVTLATALGAGLAWLTAYELARWPLVALLTAAAIGSAGILAALYWLDRRGSGGFRVELELIWKALRGGTRGTPEQPRP
jgi:O-antigen/teichoic acid export membrane protein